ncbi:uncharacterized protein [Antennarius striatus]|uniref:uncharacterized protein n=1 Tax=Antennarius striatus TaxID=241820 RepID=UPI0035AF9F90
MMKQAVTLLMLVAFGTNAELEPEKCGSSSHTLQVAELEKVYGHWVLVDSFSDVTEEHELYADLMSSHVDLELLPDNHTISYIEANLYKNKSCVTYSMNATIPHDGNTLDIKSPYMLEKDGITTMVNEHTNITFHETCSDSLVLVYRGESGKYLLIYRREGTPLDAAQINEAHKDWKKLADCLDIIHDYHINYESKEFCNKKPIPEHVLDRTTVSMMKLAVTLLMLVAISTNAELDPEKCGTSRQTVPPKDLDKVYGDWFLVDAFSDVSETHEFYTNLRCSHIELRLLPDNHTVNFLEGFVYKNMTYIFFTTNLTIPDDGNTLDVVATELVDEHGVPVKVNENATVTFHETCPDCLILVYKGGLGHYLLSYRREERHHDETQIKEAHSDLEKLANCLGLTHNSEINYEATTSYCHNSPAPEHVLDWTTVSMMKLAVTLLMLVAIGTNAELDPEKCGTSSQTVPPKDLDKVYGDWILVDSFSNIPDPDQLYENLTSGHAELRLLPDNQTIKFTERYMYQNKSCMAFFNKATIPSDGHAYPIQSPALMVKDGVTSDITEPANVTFHETCPDCLILVYRGGPGVFLLSYRREGLPLNATQIKEAHSDFEKLAVCLGTSVENPLNYKDITEFCHKKYSPPDHFLNRTKMSMMKLAVTLLMLVAISTNGELDPEKCGTSSQTVPPKDLDKVYGDWILVDSFANIPDPDQLQVNLTSGHAELRLLPDNQTIKFTERYMYQNRSCLAFFNKATIPSDGHTLPIQSPSLMVKDGVTSDITEPANVTFHETCPDCLILVYRGGPGVFLISYRREGLPLNATQIKEAHSDLEKLAVCLGTSLEGSINYENITEFCHKKYSPPDH